MLSLSLLSGQQSKWDKNVDGEHEEESLLDNMKVL